MNRDAPVKGKNRPFAVFDIDGTLIRWQMYHAVADALAKHGYLDNKAHQTVRNARMLWKQRNGEDSFKAYEKLLVEEYEKLLVQLPYDQFTKATKEVFEEYKDQVYVYTRELIKQLKNRGYLLFAISGSQVEIVSQIARYWGFDDYFGTVYEHKTGTFTGKVTNFLGKKDLVIKKLATKHNATYNNSIAVGDSEGDITMLEAVEHPIAFNPNNKLYEYARSHGWKIVIERKNVVYELEDDNGHYVLA